MFFFFISRIILVPYSSHEVFSVDMWNLLTSVYLDRLHSSSPGGATGPHPHCQLTFEIRGFPQRTDERKESLGLCALKRIALIGYFVCRTEIRRSHWPNDSVTSQLKIYYKQ